MMLFQINLYHIWCKFSIMILKISAKTAPSNCVTYDIRTEKAQFSMPNLHFFGANLMHFLAVLHKIVRQLLFYDIISID